MRTVSEACLSIFGKLSIWGLLLASVKAADALKLALAITDSISFKSVQTDVEGIETEIILDSRLGVVTCIIAPLPRAAPPPAAVVVTCAADTEPRTAAADDATAAPGGEDGAAPDLAAVTATVAAATGAEEANSASSSAGIPAAAAATAGHGGAAAAGGGYAAAESPRAPAAELRVLALAGCAVNGAHVRCGARVPLRSGDVVSLLPPAAAPATDSTAGAPLAYVFTHGDPAARLVAPHPAAAAALPPVHAVPLCQLCAALPRNCLELQPCGHTFCAPCLSHHLYGLLQSGGPLGCPHGCVDTSTIARSAAAAALLDDLPVYLDRLSHMMPWGAGDAATPRGGEPRSPMWPAPDSLRPAGSGGGAAAAAAPPASPFAGAARAPGAGAAAAAWPPLQAAADPRSPARRHAELSPMSPLSAASPRHGPRPPHSRLPSAPLSPDASPRRGGGRRRAASLQGPIARPDACHACVPLSRDHLPLSMQALHTQQSEMSSRRLKLPAADAASLRIVTWHVYTLAHGAVASTVCRHDSSPLLQA